MGHSNDAPFTHFSLNWVAADVEDQLVEHIVGVWVTVGKIHLVLEFEVVFEGKSVVMLILVLYF